MTPPDPSSLLAAREVFGLEPGEEFKDYAEQVRVEAVAALLTEREEENTRLNRYIDAENRKAMAHDLDTAGVLLSADDEVDALRAEVTALTEEVERLNAVVRTARGCVKAVQRERDDAKARIKRFSERAQEGVDAWKAKHAALTKRLEEAVKVIEALTNKVDPEGAHGPNPRLVLPELRAEIEQARAFLAPERERSDDS